MMPAILRAVARVKIFLGSHAATIDANGNCLCGGAITLPGNVTQGQVVTATTTAASNNTSAFSLCRAVTTPSPTPTPYAQSHSLAVTLARANRKPDR